jgi:glycosyltransferase involved in cell wall biosynthesis
MFVSVVMPIHNGQPFVREAVASVLAQTHRDLELVAVDDGSSDDTPAILQEFAAADPRVRVVAQARGGIARARNRALREARAEWVVNLDHDDVMLPNRVERQIAFIGTHPDVKVFSSRGYYINAAGTIFGKTKCEPITTREAFERYYATNQPIGINQSAAAMHRPTVLAVGGYRSQFDAVEDIDLWNRLTERGHLVLQQEEVLIKYRIHGSSVTASRTRQSWQKAAWAVACMEARRAGRSEPSWEEHRANLRGQPWWRRVQRERQLLACVNYRMAGCDVANRRWAPAIGHLLIASASSPSYVAGRLVKQLHLPGLRAPAGRRGYRLTWGAPRSTAAPTAGSQSGEG